MIFKLFKMIVLIVVLCVVIGSVFAFVFKEALIRNFIEGNLSDTINAAIDVRAIRFDPFAGSLLLEDVAVGSPQPFEKTTFSKIPKIFVLIEPVAIFKRRLEVKKLEVIIDEANIVRQGHTTNLALFNIEAFKKVAASSQDGSSATSTGDTSGGLGKGPGKTEGGKKALALHIQTLAISIGRVNYIDLTQEPALTREIPVNINRVYNDVSDIGKTLTPLVFEIVVKAAIGEAVSINFKNIEIKANDALDTLKKTVESVIDKNLGSFEKEQSPQNIAPKSPAPEPQAQEQPQEQPQEKATSDTQPVTF